MPFSLLALLEEWEWRRTSFNKKCTTLEEFPNAPITGHLRFLFQLGQNKNVQNIFCLHENEKPAFSNLSGLKSVFEKLRFRDGSVWKVGLTGEIKLCFQILPA